MPKQSISSSLVSVSENNAFEPSTVSDSGATHTDTPHTVTIEEVHKVDLPKTQETGRMREKKSELKDPKSRDIKTRCKQKKVSQPLLGTSDLPHTITSADVSKDDPTTRTPISLEVTTIQEQMPKQSISSSLVSVSENTAFEPSTVSDSGATHTDTPHTVTSEEVHKEDLPKTQESGRMREKKSKLKDSKSRAIKTRCKQKKVSHSHSKNICFVCKGKYFARDSKGPWVGCKHEKKCKSWAHYTCVGWGSFVGQNVDDKEYVCPKCS